jgi:hypothetical protein
MSYFPLFYPRVPLHFGPVNRKGEGGGMGLGIDRKDTEDG